ncbi:MAG: hypothetical protein OEU36_15735 [Gammaproteobacteria bacterium]|nr:hypothetical protein [Gammaproteobacteria bacterium]
MNPIKHVRIFLVFVSVLLVSPLAKADWINLTGAETASNIAEIYVLDDHVQVNLEVYVGDLKIFEDLVPDDWLKKSTDRATLAERLRRFSSNTFRVTTDAGEELQANLKLAEARLRTDRQSPFAGMINPYTRQRVPEAPEDKRVLYAELVYPFKGKPEALTITPPLDNEGRALVTIGFIAYHKAVPIIDFRYLGAPARVTLEWEDPWYTKFDNPNLKRHHKSALMSFLYVEPYEVRHEILTRVRDLEQWMDLGLRGDEYIEVDELEPLKQRIGEFLLTRNPVRVDGQALKPILDRTNYVKVAITGISLIEKPERLEISTAIIGVIITYLTDGMPQEATVDWELFTDQIQRVPATAIDPAGPLMSYVEPQDNVHTWTNFLKNYKLPKVERVALDESLTTIRLPLASILCLGALLPVFRLWRTRKKTKQSRRPLIAAGIFLLISSIALYPFARVSVAKPTQIAATLTDEDGKVILQSLLKNVYRAFDFREEEDVYDKLALSVSGDLLADVYLQSRKSLEVQRAGGAQAKVKEVEVLEASVDSQPDRPLAYTLKAKWTALGTVGHWGHVHMRKNLYDALVTVDGVDGNWKITGLELLEEKRIDPSANLGASNEQNTTDETETKN